MEGKAPQKNNIMRYFFMEKGFKALSIVLKIKKSIFGKNVHGN